MGNRLQLQQIFEDILGVVAVYFQPPETLQLQYPCIVYSKSKPNTIYADDNPYRHHAMYQATIIDSNPDSLIPAYVAAMPLSAYDRHYTRDNLHHDVYNVYF